MRTCSDAARLHAFSTEQSWTTPACPCIALRTCSDFWRNLSMENDLQYKWSLPAVDACFAYFKNQDALSIEVENITPPPSSSLIDRSQSTASQEWSACPLDALLFPVSRFQYLVLFLLKPRCFEYISSRLQSETNCFQLSVVRDTGWPKTFEWQQ